MTSGEAAKRILIIDNDEDFRTLFTIFLNLEGYHVQCVPNGVDAITLLQRSTVDLIITELKYSFLDGFQFLKWLKDESGLSIPVLVFTAAVEKGLTERLLDGGASAVLYKPLEDHLILDEIEKLMQFGSAGFDKINISRNI